MLHVKTFLAAVLFLPGKTDRGEPLHESKKGAIQDNGGPGVQKKGSILGPAPFVCKLSRRRPTFPHSYPCSIIGPARLNYRVRDGNGCDPRGMATGKT